MATPEVASKGAQGALFAIAGLCFLLPFVSLSCASKEAARGMEFEQEDQTLTGLQLGMGGERREGFDPSGPLGDADPDADEEFSIPAEPFALIAFVAALVGLSLVFVRVTRSRLLGAAIAGTVGAGSLVLLATSPTLRALGLSTVTLLYGFWITLGIFGLAASVHLIQLRFNRAGSVELRGGEPPRPPPGPAP
jgi:hypothetical protein